MFVSASFELATVETRVFSLNAIYMNQEDSKHQTAQRKIEMEWIVLAGIPYSRLQGRLELQNVQKSE